MKITDMVLKFVITLFISLILFIFFFFISYFETTSNANLTEYFAKSDFYEKVIQEINDKIDDEKITNEDIKKILDKETIMKDIKKFINGNYDLTLTKEKINSYSDKETSKIIIDYYEQELFRKENIENLQLIRNDINRSSLISLVIVVILFFIIIYIYIKYIKNDNKRFIGSLLIKNGAVIVIIFIYLSKFYLNNNFKIENLVVVEDAIKLCLTNFSYVIIRYGVICLLIGFVLYLVSSYKFYREKYKKILNQGE